MHLSELVDVDLDGVRLQARDGAPGVPCPPAALAAHEVRSRRTGGGRRMTLDERAFQVHENDNEYGIDALAIRVSFGELCRVRMHLTRM